MVLRWAMVPMAPVTGGYKCGHTESDFVGLPFRGKILIGFRGRFRLFNLGGTIVCWAPNPYGKVGLLESSSNVIVSGSGVATVTEENVGISIVWVPDSSVELRIFGSFFVVGLACLIVPLKKYITVSWTDWYIGGPL